MQKRLKSVELFTGAGGLAMGLELAGFSHSHVIEWDHDSCETLRENLKGRCSLVKGWKVVEGDVKNFDYGQIDHDVDLVAGGPPCQPFSLAGKHGGFNDERDMWPEAVRSIRELQPKAFIFENVKGLLRPAFQNYFEYIRLQLASPSVVRTKGESWSAHYRRLKKVAPLGNGESEYIVRYKLLNAANYGVPQKRERVVIVGFRRDVNPEWDFPEPTHAQKPSAPTILPWRTVRDAILDLPALSATRPNSMVTNHRFQPGAKFYPGHTGSPLDLPGKTLKAGDHGVPGGENMLVKKDGTCRYFSVREAARLQCFPDDYVFPVSWTESMRQLGNAVPVLLAQKVGESVYKALANSPSQTKQKQYARTRELQPA